MARHSLVLLSSLHTIIHQSLAVIIIKLLRSFCSDVIFTEFTSCDVYFSYKMAHDLVKIALFPAAPFVSAVQQDLSLL